MGCGRSGDRMLEGWSESKWPYSDEVTECYKKDFALNLRNYQSNRMIPVYLWRGSFGNLNFTVCAGNYSEYSYTGCFFPEKLVPLQAMERLEQMNKELKLFK